MSPRSSSIPIYRERCALQSIKYRGWVSAPALLPAGEGTVRDGLTVNLGLMVNFNIALPMLDCQRSLPRY